MTHFIQLHILTSYPPSNLNRDDTGNPKTARVGGFDRLRVSSQSLKRAWRTSELFQQRLSGNIGTRTKRLGREAFDVLVGAGVSEKLATEWASKIAKVYGAVKKDAPLDIEQLVHISPEERQSLDALIQLLAVEKRAPTDEELKTLLHEQHAVDIAMFGRMLAAEPEFNTDASIQVAHAFGVHATAIEDDYFTAVDDLNKSDTGAGHVGEAGFAAAVFYLYICIDRDGLKKNLGGDDALTKKALEALIESALTIGPSGKQNSFASRARAHYALVEKGSQQPRSLALAYVKPISSNDYALDAISALKSVQKNMNKVYGDCADSDYEINVLAGQGTLKELLAFVAAE